MPFRLPQSILDNAYSPIGAVISETVTDNKIFAGETYGAATRFDLAGGAAIDFVFDTTAVTRDFVIFLPFVFGAYGAGPISIDLYTGITYSGGTAVDSANRSFNSSNTPQTSIVAGPTIADVGTLFPWQYSILSNGVPATTTTGSEGGPSLPLDIGSGRVIMARLTNTDSTTANCTFAFDWFEFDRKP